jgi:hypothetical protein
MPSAPTEPMAPMKPRLFSLLNESHRFSVISGASMTEHSSSDCCGSSPHRVFGQLFEMPVLRSNVESFALPHWFRRLRVRWEIRDDIHEPFLSLACSIICRRRLVSFALCQEFFTG